MQTRKVVRWMSLGVAASCTVALAHSWRRPFPHDPYNTGCERRPIDLVICLDTSGSMTALIDSARAKLWDIVHQLAKAKPTPQLRVGLLTYGSPNVSTAGAGWVVRQMDLTHDLDGLYARMMSLTTNGGEEYVGWVLNDALKTMNWSRDPRALKLIFVAGNESADQAAEVFNFRAVAERARVEGITINAVYCGNFQIGLSEKWQEVALHGGGDFSAIDMERGTVQIQTPYDKELFELNIKLNATYIPYGSRGDARWKQQQEQDANAERLGLQTAGTRVAAKASPLYNNKDWDLLDAAAAGDVKLESVAKEDLPAAMQPMSAAEREAYVGRKQAERTEVQRQIQDLSARRDGFLEDKRKTANPGQAGLDEAMLQSIRKQAESKGFTF